MEVEYVSSIVLLDDILISINTVRRDATNTSYTVENLLGTILFDTIPPSQ